MKKIYIIALFLIVFSGIQLMAQPIPTTIGSHGTTGNATGAPLDGGLSILLVLGAAYGGKKVYGHKKVKEEN